MNTSIKELLEGLNKVDAAYDAGEYMEAAGLIRQLSYFAVNNKNGLSDEERTELIRAILGKMERFSTCPDEKVWFDMYELKYIFC